MNTMLLTAARPPAFGSTPPTGLPYFDVFCVAIAVLIVGVSVGVWVKKKQDEAEDLRTLRKLKRDGKWPGSTDEPPLPAATAPAPAPVESTSSPIDPAAPPVVLPPLPQPAMVVEVSQAADTPIDETPMPDLGMEGIDAPPPVVMQREAELDLGAPLPTPDAPA